MLTFKEAKKACRKVGTSRASGDALRSMYAEMIAFKWYAIGNPEKFYRHLQSSATDDDITNEARRLLRDHGEALDAMLTLA